MDTAPSFDFDSPVPRTDSDSYKWHKYQGKDIIPMWVADMDFQSPPAVLDALHRRVEHGIFGYGRPDPALKEVLVAHLVQKYDWQIDPGWIVWLPGLVCGVNVASRSVGRYGAGIATTTPIYPPFLTAPKFSSKKLQTFKMRNALHQWHLDFEEMERQVDHRTALMLLCNPHNPTGRVFTMNELQRLAAFCLDRGITICSDEIHCDLVLEPGCKHIPLASISAEVADHTITLMAPSKTYNIPGLGCSFAVISNPKLRNRFKRAMAGIVPSVNLFGFAATLAAYRYGNEWLKALLSYLRSNRDLVFREINGIAGLTMTQVEATYLAWIDTRSSGISSPGRFFESAGVGLSDGASFGAPGFVRLNFGCPRSILAEALDRIRHAMESIGTEGHGS